ncbi:hypothetical protein AUC68_01130 [Methyloceanibacter methanicus]|uniref:Uncharacterized protein n=1 Tax=Methyloceanibacter methanicus TaxID=1774968 RepID=A0A1E3W3G5_9HYPH|nr:hypothetical protein [Methyloceanibacter methanicus]ODS00280.1 hypothetical protein AUC68_01130 [Methyloceanibacter methanicus]
MLLRLDARTPLVGETDERLFSLHTETEICALVEQADAADGDVKGLSQGAGSRDLHAPGAEVGKFEPASDGRAWKTLANRGEQRVAEREAQLPRNPAIGIQHHRG